MMDQLEVGRLWEGNAEAWTKLSRAGYDIYRDYLNTPWFLRMLPDVRGLAGLDIGCGEGTNTRRVADHGAMMTGVDIAETFVRHAQALETADPRGVRFVHGSALQLPFSAASFDFATAFMSLMDVPHPERALQEAARVLRPGGFLQFSISHPCTDTPHRRNLRDASHTTYAIEIGRYFDRIDGRIDEWSFGSAPPEAKPGLAKFRVPRFHRTLSGWLNAVVEAGLAIEHVQEPTADDASVAACSDLQDTQIAPCFLHVLARKPAVATA